MTWPNGRTTGRATCRACVHSFTRADADATLGRNADDRHGVAVQGSGAFAVEAAIGTLVPRYGKLLELINGAYGSRMRTIASVIGRTVASIDWPEDQPVDPAALDRRLADDSAISHVAVVHCETTTGILNPVEAVAEVAARHGRHLLVDAMSAFGALPIDARATPFTALMASSNTCLEGAPGLAFALVRRDALPEREGNAHSLSLDLHAQERGFKANAQWRFTPPTHVVAAFAEHAEEGGVAGRGARATPQTIACSSTAWRRSASAAFCRGRFRRRSSSRSTCRPIPPSSWASSTIG